jgi:hypothetical protein
LTKLLVYHAGGKYSSIEIINLDESNPSLTCKSLAKLPLDVVAAKGNLYQGTTPIICGGYTYSSVTATYHCECYSYKNGAWMPDLTLNTCRSDHSSMVLKNPSSQTEEDIIFVSGGSNPNSLSSVEAYDGKSWDQKRFANMPAVVSHHCLVKINDSMLMSIGGLISWPATGKTYFFDVVKNTWMVGPLMNTPRADHSCGIMDWKNPSTGKMEKVVIAASGNDADGKKSNSVELLFLGNYENNKAGWSIGPPLPVSASYTSMVEYKNGVILVGGLYQGTPYSVTNQNLYQLQSPFGPWTTMKQTLKDPFRGESAFLIPDDLVNCH